MSTAAKQLHKEWESPELWPRIAEALAVESARRKSRRPVWPWLSLCAAAAVVIIAVILFRPGRPVEQADTDFLTEQTLREVQQAEATYMNSIQKLSKLAEPKLEKTTTPLAGAYREKLVVLDSAIQELRATLDQNPYNSHLRTELASLYREKQQTLQELLKREQKN
jgi:hypothetical protein